MIHIVEAYKVHSRHQGLEGLAILILMGGGYRSHGAPMEAVFEREKPGAQGLTFTTLEAGVGARQLHRCFVRLRPAVAEEGAVEAAPLRQTKRQLGLPFMEVQVGDMHQLAALSL